MVDATINPARLNGSLEELGRIGDTPEGMQRLAFTPADMAGREYTISLMRRAGMEIHIDSGGNIVARKGGSVPNLPALALGSHTDTVPVVANTMVRWESWRRSKWCSPWPTRISH